MTLRVRVIGTDLPGRSFDDTHDQLTRAPVYVGVQRGREVVDAVPADRESVTFDVEFRVERRKDGTVNFLGPYAQGTPDDRFFYLCWGVQQKGHPFAMFRRLKLRLGHYGWDEVQKAVAAGTALTVHLRLTDDKGGPLCATPPATHLRWDPPPASAPRVRRARG
jgi:hypothetical protein